MKMEAEAKVKADREAKRLAEEKIKADAKAKADAESALKAEAKKKAEIETRLKEMERKRVEEERKAAELKELETAMTSLFLEAKEAMTEWKGKSLILEAKEAMVEGNGKKFSETSAPAASTVEATIPAGAMLHQDPKEENQGNKPKPCLQGSDLSKTKKPKSPFFSPEQHRLLLLMMKILWQFIQQSRDSQGVGLDVFLVPADSSIGQTAPGQGHRLAHVTQREGHSLGALRLYVFGALPDLIAELSGVQSADTQNCPQYPGMSMERRQKIMYRMTKQFRTDLRKAMMAYGCGGEALEHRSREPYARSGRMQ